MNYLSISGIIVFVTSIFSGLLAVLKVPKRNTGVMWGLFSFAVASWGFGLFKGFATSVEYTALFWGRYLNLSAIFIPLFFFHFVVCFTNRIKEKRGELLFYYFVCFSCFVLATIFPNIFVPQVRRIMTLQYYPRPGLLYFVFTIFFSYLETYGIFLLFKELRMAVGIRKNQIKYLLFGVAIGFLGGTTAFLPVFGIKIHPIGIYLVPLYVLIIAYAIIKYRLMDINIALTRTGIFLIVYTLVLGMPFWIGYHTKSWFIPTSFAVILASMGPIIYNYLRRRAEKVLLKEQRRYQEILRELGRKMIRERKDLGALLNGITTTLYQEVKSTFAGMYILSDKKKAYPLKYKHPDNNYPFLDEINADSAFIADLSVKKKPFFLELSAEKSLPNFPEEVLIIPYFAKGKLFGFSVVGPKHDKTMYTQDDMIAFETLSLQASIAIENCLFWQEEKKIEKIRREKSMDHLSSSMAHEILNPVMCVVGTVEDIKITVMEDWKDSISGDKINFIKDKLSRTVNNLLRIVKMLKSVREFSRGSTGEITLFKMSDVVGNFMDMFQPHLKRENIKFTVEVEPDIYVQGDKIHVEEVLLNLGTNAIHAVCGVQKPGDRKVSLKVYKDSEDTCLTEFRDNGYGIGEDMLEDIFLDYVTTTGSSEGEGMGLSRVRKIIENHGGKVWAESKGPMQGVTFFIQLPLAKFP